MKVKWNDYKCSYQPQKRKVVAIKNIFLITKDLFITDPIPISVTQGGYRSPLLILGLSCDHQDWNSDDHSN